MAAAQLAVEFVKVFWLLLPAIAIVRIAKSPGFKGRIGEFRVSRRIWWQLDRRIYHAFHNVILPTADGTTQIDHIVVSRYGIFVIETKNMRGIISGGRHDRLWTQQIGTHVSSFQNPLHQNYKHIKTLHELFAINESYIFSLIVFVGTGTFTKEMPGNIFYKNEFIAFIKKKKKTVLTSAQVVEIETDIKKERLRNNFSNRRKHIRHVQAIAAQKMGMLQPCPLCGSQMILREATKDRNSGKTFWGCSEFPECKGTRNAK